MVWLRELGEVDGSTKIPMKFDIRIIGIDIVREMCVKYHPYASAGGRATYAFGVFENDICVASFAWQPPPFGAAKSVCPEFPNGVLALSRMVAVPRSERALKHISKPLMVQMKKLIDRTRWPVLITYSDSSVGHTGYVYQCSGWEKTLSRSTNVFVDSTGARVSSYQNGVVAPRSRSGVAEIQRWENWACARGSAKQFVEMHGWKVVPIFGKVWASGRQAHTVIKNT